MKEQDFVPRFPGKLVAIEGDHCAFVPADLPPTYAPSADVIDLNDQCLLALGELRAVIPHMPNPELLTYPFLRREAVLSSKIEGTRTELEQLYLFEMDERDDQVEQMADAREVHNYVLALEHGLKAMKELPICNRLLKSMHKILLSNVSDGRGQYKNPGEFRDDQAFIGSSFDISQARYVPPPPDKIELLMRGLEAYVHSKQKRHSDLVRIAVAHYQFEAIHPFSDGNGRIGRLLISMLLASWGILPEPLLYLSAYFERNVDEYRQRLWKVSSRYDWNGWVQFFLKGVFDEARDATHRAHEVLKLRENYRTTLQDGRATAKTLALLDWLFRTPFITASDAAKLLGLSYNGGRANLEKLIDAGIVFHLDEREWGRIYYAKPILELLR